MRLIRLVSFLCFVTVLCFSSCQKKENQILIVTKDSLRVSFWSGVDSVKILTNDSWEISGSESWLRILSPTSGIGNATVSFRYDVNLGWYGMRTATLLIKSAGRTVTFRIIQDQSYLKASATLLAGGGGSSQDEYNGPDGHLDGIGSEASFGSLRGLEVDNQGNLYVVDVKKVRKITPEGVVTTMPGLYPSPYNPTGPNDSWNNPGDVIVDKQGNMYVSDRNDNAIYKRTPSGVISLLAGGNAIPNPGFADGNGASAKFNCPLTMVMDSQGNIIVNDELNYRIRRITPSGDVTTIAGQSWFGFTDGPRNFASFHLIQSETVDSLDNVYVADWGNSAVRKITPDGTVKTLVSGRGAWDGPLLQATIEEPTAIAADKKGNVFVFDRGHKIRMISAKGMVYTLDVNRNFGYCENGLIVGPDNTLYIADQSHWRIYKITIDKMPEF
ncbi:hypothetical protein [Chitinophaga filiformis]|uniref:NHL repeat-containing protein n=1 Tax=Chitinophaga filiformis TaxID=104663 RepID=A0A1G8B0K2_CHIFI|nr:hypothetical protein [Chitinophaga filiformis]SDH26676.1 hypothetical protein SAMN04488121_11062 [Chitinophaga filiformis]